MEERVKKQVTITPANAAMALRVKTAKSNWRMEVKVKVEAEVAVDWVRLIK